MAAGFDPARWLIVGMDDETGRGRLAGDLRRLFPAMRLALLPSVRFPQNRREWPNAVRLGAAAADDEVAALVAGLQGVVFFEEIVPPNLVRVAAGLGVATVFVPMWEWFNPHVPDVARVTRFACQNAMGVRMLGRVGVRRARQLTWPLDFAGLAPRSIAGAARVFVHNSGVYEEDDRKSLRETLAAFRRVQGDDLRLVVRVQNEIAWPVDDPRVEMRIGNLPDKAALYAEGDVIVQPSKAEGLGFAILEAMAAGYPVITTDYPPMNEYVRDRRFLVRPRWGQRLPVQASYIPQAHLKVPSVGSLARVIRRCAGRDLRAVGRANRAWAEAVFAPDKLRREWEGLFAEAASTPASTRWHRQG